MIRFNFSKMPVSTILPTNQGTISATALPGLMKMKNNTYSNSLWCYWRKKVWLQDELQSLKKICNIGICVFVKDGEFGQKGVWNLKKSENSWGGDDNSVLFCHKTDLSLDILVLMVSQPTKLCWILFLSDTSVSLVPFSPSPNINVWYVFNCSQDRKLLDCLRMKEFGSCWIFYLPWHKIVQNYCFLDVFLRNFLDLFILACPLPHLDMTGDLKKQLSTQISSKVFVLLSELLFCYFLKTNFIEN